MLILGVNNKVNGTNNQGTIGTGWHKVALSRSLNIFSSILLINDGWNYHPGKSYIVYYLHNYDSTVAKCMIETSYNYRRVTKMRMVSYNNNYYIECYLSDDKGTSYITAISGDFYETNTVDTGGTVVISEIDIT